MGREVCKGEGGRRKGSIRTSHESYKHKRSKPPTESHMPNIE
jgi:hypothetical protein